jgi:hypothetical protein
MPAPPQTYATHVRRPTAWTAAFLMAFVATLPLLWWAVWVHSLRDIAFAVLACSVLTALAVMRMADTRLQDRIIRLEMAVRLTVLGRAADVARLSLAQLVALRFASDSELPLLVDRTLAEQLTPTSIKQAITNWQGDHLRV